MSVDWSQDDEVSEVPTLLALWKSKAPIDISDALKLLGGETSFRRTVVRYPKTLSHRLYL
jgi:hypothetical protein